MIQLQTQCSHCDVPFAWKTFCDLQRQGSQFVVPMTEHVLCPGCNHTYTQGDILPVLFLPPIDRKDYEVALDRYFGVLPDHFRVITRYAIGNGNELALCLLSGAFCLLFMSHDGGMLESEKISGAVTELGAREKVQTIASIIGATKIETD